MHIIINHTSMTPIYEQIVSQIRADIINGDLAPGTALPSVRMLSRELKDVYKRQEKILLLTVLL